MTADKLIAKLGALVFGMVQAGHLAPEKAAELFTLMDAYGTPFDRRQGNEGPTYVEQREAARLERLEQEEKQRMEVRGDLDTYLYTSEWDWDAMERSCDPVAEQIDGGVVWCYFDHMRYCTIFNREHATTPDQALSQYKMRKYLLELGAEDVVRDVNMRRKRMMRIRSLSELFSPAPPPGQPMPEPTSGHTLASLREQVKRGEA